MSTGAIKTVANRAKGLRFADERLVVEFSDGRELHVPLALYPSLRDASAAERADWTLLGPGKSFHWKQLDLDLSIAGLIQGLREAIPTPPKFKPSARRRSA